MFPVPAGRLTPTNETFVAHRDTRAGRNGVKTVSDRRLARAQQRMLLEFPRHDELARRINLGKLALRVPNLKMEDTFQTLAARDSFDPTGARRKSTRSFAS